MRILIFGINYYPELTGIGKYTAEMATWLSKQGHSVLVITGKPYYPEWKIHKHYKWKLWQKETIEGVRILRSPLYVPSKQTPFRRILHELSFLIGVVPIWLSILFKKKYDIIISISPPFHFGLMPIVYSKLRKSDLLIHVQDLQVDAAKNLSMLKSNRLLNTMFKLERYIMKKSSAISTITLGMQDKILEKNIPDIRTILFPNWVDEDFIKPLPIEKSLREEFGIKFEDKVILYSGNLGEKQGLEILIDVAKSYLGKINIHFLIVGTGSYKKNLEELALLNNLTNIKFFPLMSYEKLPSLLATADIHLILQRKSASDLMMPSKLTSILAAGGVSIVTALPHTSLYKIVEKHKLGIISEPESSAQLILAIDKALLSDLTPYKINARDYAIKHLSKHNIMQKFEQDLVHLRNLPFVKTNKRIKPKNPIY
jgi:colanic acid biosynthesis glycosyl transferase WcaI